MQITIDVPDMYINNALEAPHSRYWCDEASWDPATLQGHVVDAEDDDTIVEFAAEDLAKGLVAMAKSNPTQFAALASGDADGVTGDVLLQFVAFGEERYG